VESVQFSKSAFGHSRTFEISDSTLISNSAFIFFGRNKDVEFEEAQQGDDGDNLLNGSVVFGHAGNDVIAGTLGDDVLHGGAARTRLREALAATIFTAQKITMSSMPPPGRTASMAVMAKTCLCLAKTQQAKLWWKTSTNPRTKLIYCLC